MPASLVVAPLLLAVVLLAAAIGKWSVRDSLVSAARELRVPQRLMPAVRLLPPVELALGLALVLVPWSPGLVVAGLLSTGLMLAYAALVARGLTMSPRPSCGCFGTVNSPISAETLVRNLVFVALGVASVGWGLAGGSVPMALVAMSAGPLLLVLLALALLVGRWALAPRGRAPEQIDFDADVDELDYLRAPIPPVMLLDGQTPVGLPTLARERAQLLVWVTCGCQRSHDAIARVHEWRAQMPQIDVRLVSTMRPEVTTSVFGDDGEAWLHDPDAQALVLVGATADPVGLLLGADGQLAGGPVGGLDALVEFGEEIREQLGASGVAGAHGN